MGRAELNHIAAALDTDDPDDPDILLTEVKGFLYLLWRRQFDELGELLKTTGWRPAPHPPQTGTLLVWAKVLGGYKLVREEVDFGWRPGMRKVDPASITPRGSTPHGVGSVSSLMEVQEQSAKLTAMRQMHCWVRDMVYRKREMLKEMLVRDFSHEYRMAADKRRDTGEIEETR